MAELRQSYMQRIREDNFRLPEEESSEKRLIDPCLCWKESIDPAEVENSEQLLDLSALCTHEREAFSGSLEVHMQPLQKIMSHSKMPR